MTVHQKHPRGNGLIKKYMLDEFQEPKDFASLLYLSQVQQARGLKQAFDAHRQHKPYCMGTLYWQFNDCWPVASWSGIDYYGRWKALHYQARNSFKPIIPLIVENQKDLEVYLANDTLEDVNVSINWTLQTFDGEMLAFDSAQCCSSANLSELVLSFNQRELIPDKLRDQLIFTVQLSDMQGHELARENHYFVPNKDMRLSKPNVKVKVSVNESLQLQLSSDVLVKDLHVDIAGEQINLSDNFFDLLPGESKTLTIYGSRKLSFDVRCRPSRRY